jgi:hypothetical protein
MAVTSYALSWFGDQISGDDKYVRLTRGSRPAERVERRLGTSLAPCALRLALVGPADTAASSEVYGFRPPLQTYLPSTLASSGESRTSRRGRNPSYVSTLLVRLVSVETYNATA